MWILVSISGACPSLRAMSRLKIVSCDKITDARIEYMRKQSKSTLDCEMKEGIWEIRIKPTDMFSRL